MPDKKKPEEASSNDAIVKVISKLDEKIELLSKGLGDLNARLQGVESKTKQIDGRQTPSPFYGGDSAEDVDEGIIHLTAEKAVRKNLDSKKVYADIKLDPQDLPVENGIYAFMDKKGKPRKLTDTHGLETEYDELLLVKGFKETPKFSSLGASRPNKYPTVYVVYKKIDPNGMPYWTNPTSPKSIIEWKNLVADHALEFVRLSSGTIEPSANKKSESPALTE
jgi:hypothetical protein